VELRAETARIQMRFLNYIAANLRLNDLRCFLTLFPRINNPKTFLEVNSLNNETRLFFRDQILVENTFEDGSKTQEIFWQSKKTGIVVFRNSEGKKEYEFYFYNGNIDGFLVNFSEDGKVRAEGHIVKKEKDGYWVNWYKNGQKSCEGDYKEGKRSGLWIYYYENGQKELEGKYHLDRERGPWVCYNRDGIKERIEVYRCGNQISITNLR
jgi:antitoxin component YwqK of YwqJK toxin-antitoxin module